MKRDSGILVAAVGTVPLAVMCRIGLSLIAVAVAAVGAGALFGGFGIAVVISGIARVVLISRYRQHAWAATG